MSPNDRVKLIKICTAADNIQAQLIRGLLEANGISCMLTGEAISRIGGITVDGLGEVPIFVREEDADAALGILRESAPDVLS